MTHFISTTIVFRLFFLILCGCSQRICEPNLLGLAGPDVRGGRGVCQAANARVRAYSMAVRGSPCIDVETCGRLVSTTTANRPKAVEAARGSRADATMPPPHRRTYGCEAHVTPRARGRSAPLVWLVGWLVGGVVERAGDACMAGWG